MSSVPQGMYCCISVYSSSVQYISPQNETGLIKSTVESYFISFIFCICLRFVMLRWACFFLTISLEAMNACVCNRSDMVRRNFRGLGLRVGVSVTVVSE